MLAKHCLDFPRLDTESADLHLVVNTAQKLDVPISQVTGRVAGLVQARSLIAGLKAVWNKLLSGQI